MKDKSIDNLCRGILDILDILERLIPDDVYANELWISAKNEIHNAINENKTIEHKKLLDKLNKTRLSNNPVEVNLRGLYEGL